METTKPFEISRHDVMSAWRLVKANDGAEGVDGETIAFQHYLNALEQNDNRTKKLKQEITYLLPNWSLVNLVIQLQALKGVALIVAVTVVSEICDLSRFDNPKQLMAYLGEDIGAFG